MILSQVVVSALVAAIFLGGCAKIRPAWDEMRGSNKSSGKEAKETNDSRETHPPQEEKPGKYACAQKNTYQISIIKSEIDPTQVEPDDEIKHTIEYALCAPSESFTVQGALTRRIIFKGKELFRDSGAQTFKAGSDTIKAEITIPKRAPNGVYSLETIIVYENVTVKRSAMFVVKRK